MITKIKNGKLVLANKIENKNLYFENDRITALCKEDLPCDVEVDAEGMYVSPGFIDMHVHGGGGYDFLDGGTEPIIKGADLHRSHGTTSILPTSLACTTDTLMDFLKDLKTVMSEGLCESRILGTHLEGPYFAISQCGAQNPDYIKSPQRDEYEVLIEKHGDIIKKWSFAPELDGSVDFCRALVKNNIVASIAHSAATFSDVEKVYNEGCRMATHLYSGMSTITRQGGFRCLGVVESVYLLDNMIAELISDGCHLPPELLRLAVKQLGIDNICLVTDAMRGAGMPDGESLLGRKGEGLKCIIEDGVAKMPDRSGFAGSVATADRLVRTMVQNVGCSIPDAVQMMTLNPARALGLKDLGQLKSGNLADIIIFDDNIDIKQVFVGGIRCS